MRTRPRLRPGPPPERASVHTYTADLGRRMSYVHRIRVPLWSFDPCFSLFPDFRLRAHTYEEMT